MSLASTRQGAKRDDGENGGASRAAGAGPLPSVARRLACAWLVCDTSPHLREGETWPDYAASRRRLGRRRWTGLTWTTCGRRALAGRRASAASVSRTATGHEWRRSVASSRLRPRYSRRSGADSGRRQSCRRSFDGHGAVRRAWAVQASWETNLGDSWLHIDRHALIRSASSWPRRMVTTALAMSSPTLLWRRTFGGSTSSSAATATSIWSTSLPTTTA